MVLHMEQVTIHYEKYQFEEVLSDICGLLNSGGGRILIKEDKKNQCHNECNTMIKKMLVNYFIELCIGSGTAITTQSINLSEYVSFIQRNYKKNVTTSIIVKAYNKKKGIIVFNFEDYFYYFFNDKKLKIVWGSDFNKPFIFQLLRDHKWALPHSYENNLYEYAIFLLNSRESTHNNNVTFRWLDGLNHIEHYYKYMSLDSALECLKNNNICFNQPSNWDDKYESRFYNANYIDNKGTDVTMPKSYACCFTSKQDNEAAWSIYSHNQQSDKSIVVEFKLNARELHRQLLTNLKDSVIYIGLVKYWDKKIIDNIHKQKIPINDLFIRAKESDNPYYYHFFDGFSKDHFFSLMLLKRDAFEHEQEIRIFVVPNSQESTQKYTLVNINWIDLIEQVRIDSKCPPEKKEELQKALSKLYFEKKAAIDAGCKKHQRNNKDIKVFLEKNLVFSDKYNGDVKNLNNKPKTILSKYFSELEERIKLISFNVYSQNLQDNARLTITLNNYQR